ncbi:MAG: hypothetical protein HY319_15675 [Armatimonadetes bacterium]|nr:hypothetical protein [Armatimonadota bacterium]
MADANRITSRSLFSDPSALSGVRRSAPPGVVQPREIYQPGEIPGAPPVVSRADAGQKRCSRKGLYFALGVGATLAVVGGAALISDSGPAQPVQSVPLSQSEKNALDHLDFLQRQGQKDGGGLKVDGLLWGQNDASPSEAYQRLREREPVYFYESEAEVPVQIRSFEQLESVRDELQTRVLKNEIRSGIDEIGRGAREFLGEIFGR